MTRDQLLAEAVARGKRDINELIVEGVVPESVVNFEELHTYLDANELGRLCDDAFLVRLLNVLGLEPDEAGELPHIAFSDEVQGELDAWLRAGRK